MITKETENRFPLSSKYNLKWMQENEMGPNGVWLTEYLLEDLPLKKGMRVLDLGCGKACSSIFLAKEKQVKVFAADLWIRPEINLKNIKDFKLENQVFPLSCEARNLPFAHEYFDAIVSIDAYQYFGTDDFYLSYLMQFLKPKGSLGIVMPGAKKEIDSSIINQFGEIWDPEIECFHTKKWWINHFSKTGLVDVKIADELEKGWQYWLEWESQNEADNMINPDKGSDLEFIKKDNGEFTRFIRIVAQKK